MFDLIQELLLWASKRTKLPIEQVNVLFTKYCYINLTLLYLGRHACTVGTLVLSVDRFHVLSLYYYIKGRHFVRHFF